MPKSDISVSTEPANAKIFIDGRKIDGKTPLKIALSKAKEYYDIDVEKDGYMRESVRIYRLRMGFVNSIAHYSCDPDVGCLYLPFLPCQFFDSEKQYILEPYKVHFVLRTKGQGLELFFDKGELLKEAEIWIDDEMKGFTDQAGVFFGLAEGKYKLALKLYDGAKWTGEFNVQKDTHTKLHFIIKNHVITLNE